MMKRLFYGTAFALLAQLAVAATLDQSVIDAREAFQLGDRAGLSRQMAAVRGHELEPYVESWLLTQRLEELTPGEVGDFVTRYGGSYVAESLRGKWLKVLGRRQQWEIFDRIYPNMVQLDQELRCYAVQSQLLRGDTEGLDEVRPLWFRQLDLPESCMPVMERLIHDGRLSNDDVWERMRRLLEGRRYGAANSIAEYLPNAQKPKPKALLL
ncbi:MAG: transglycosylase, partial [Georgfuchsia sp.]